MNTLGSRLIGGALVALLLLAPSTSANAGERRFTLADAIPNDVFVYVAGQHNPERAFLDDYWGEVFDALKQCGVGADLMELIDSLLGAEQQAEVGRLKQRASDLWAGVDWDQLVGREVVFAERLAAAVQTPGGGISMGPPDMVGLFRGSPEGVAANFDGLVAILEGVVAEINGAVGSEVLAVSVTTRMGADLAGTNLLAAIPGAPPLPLTVAKRDDVILITLGEQILTDVLGLLDGSGSKPALAADPRFKAAFAKLPPAEDEMVFFDMQALLKPIKSLADLAIGAAGSPGEGYRNTGMTPEAQEFNGQALAAYQSGDIAQALALVKQAHDADPRDSVVLYNLACFSALSEQKSEALTWLEKAVEAGFHAPSKIAGDSDLVSVHDDPRYKAAVAKAAELAAQHNANDIVLNSVKSGEAHELNTQAWEAYEQEDYERGLKLVQQAYELTPKDSRVLYYLACFHALLGHEDDALGFLEKAVHGGFYSPQHISNDPDLESIRSHERYQTALADAAKHAGKIAAKKAEEKVAMAKRLVDRLMNAVSVLDYVASVASTDGHSVRTESIAVLVPDAKDRPIYPVFGKRKQLTNFDRYLPQETMSFSVSGGFDLGELYQFLEDTVRVAGPEGEKLLAQWEAVQTQLDLDVKQDVLGWIDGDSVTVTLDDGGGSVWMIKVSDQQAAREKVAALLDFVSAQFGQLAAGNPGMAMLAFTRSPTEHAQLEEFENLQFLMSPQPVVWGVTDGHLVFGTSADAVALCLETARGEHPNIRENARVMNEAIVPDGAFTSVALTDQRALGDQLAAGIGVVSMVGGMATMAIPDPQIRPVIAKITGMLAKLAPVARKIDFFKSTASCTTFDGHAWHTRAVTHYIAPAERTASAAP